MNKESIDFFVESVLGKKNISITNTEIQHILFPDKDYTIKGVYGRGSYGLVLKVENKKSEKFALKLLRSEPGAIHEFRIQKDFAEYNMSPQIIDFKNREFELHKTKLKWVQALMEPIDSTIYGWLVEKKHLELNSIELLEGLKCLFKKKYLLKYNKPYLHGDMHIQNVVVLKDGKTLGFIDFGLTSRAQPMYQILDFITLLTSLKSMLDIFDPNSIYPKLLKKIKTSRFDSYIDLCQKLFLFCEEMYSIHLDWRKFVIHPSRALVYFEKKGLILHGYKDAQYFPQSIEEWGELKGLPSPAEIKKVFKTIELPKIVT